MYGLFLSQAVPVMLVIFHFGLYHKGKQHVVSILWENTGIDLCFLEWLLCQALKVGFVFFFFIVYLIMMVSAAEMLVTFWLASSPG